MQPLTPAVRRPPPPSAQPFPFCKCNRTLGTVPFVFDPVPVLTRNGANRVICLTLRTKPCVDPSSPCCTQPMAKIEWWTKDACRGSVKQVTLDGTKVDQQWSKGTFKIPGLNMPASAVPDAGREVCIELDAKGTCPSLNTFCARAATTGSCYYVAFNQAKSW